MVPPPIARLVAAIGTLALGGCATVSPAKSSRWHIPPDSVFLAEIPPPPAPGSAIVRRQIDEILALQARATPEKVAVARWDYDLTVFTFGIAFDPGLTGKKYPQTARLFRELNNLVERVNDDLKDTFRSPHPFQVDDRVKRFVDAVPGYDYPSYHSARCALFQRVLTDLDPARAEAFVRVSRMVEQDRVFAGEHFPYSIAAGRQLGALLYAALEKDANFRAEIARIRSAEWTPPPGARNSF
ncbi:MAG TPA: hypothetical protein VIM61_13720 [Chthoniobacterales bacterium]